MSKRKKRKIMNFIGRIVALVGVIALLLFCIYIFRLEVLQIKYIFILIGIILFIYSIMYIFILGKKIKIPLKIFANVIIIIFTSIFIFGVIYVDRTILFLNRINNNLVQKEEYYLITLKEKKYTNIGEFTDKKIGFYATSSTKNVKFAIEELTKKISFVEEDYDDVQLLFDALQNDEIDGMLINGSLKAILNEDYSYIAKLINEIAVIYVPIETNDIVKVVDVTNTPFNIFIIGSDSYGTIDKVSNSDVNMLTTINPKTNEVLLTSIPRDYYVELYNTNGGMDKLTHAGYYGIETTVKTVENLLDTEINYYIKVNFSTVIKIVDIIGGIEVNSDYAFCDSGRIGCYKKGYNKLNGKQALAFARERKSFNGGDRVRGQNQQKIITAIIDKVTSSPSILRKYPDILSAIESNFQTNLDEKSIKKLITIQLNKKPMWKFINQSLNGSDYTVYATYSFSNPNGIYVMKPNEETIEASKIKINEILNAK